MKKKTLSLFGFTSIILMFLIIFWEFYVVIGVVVLLSIIWGYFATNNAKIWDKFMNISSKYSRICAMFMIIFTPAYFFYIPLRLFTINAIPLWDLVFDLIVAVSILAMGIFMFLFSKYRNVVPLSILMVAIWLVMPGDWLLDHQDQTTLVYLTPYIFTVSIALMLGINAGLGIGQVAGEARRLLKDKSALVSRPWIKNALATFNLGAIPEDEEIIFNTRAKIGIALIFLMLPGIFVQTNAISPSVTITPNGDDVTFNFWAHSNVSTYTQDEIAAFNKHKVNLDITLHLTKENIHELVKFEQVMPNITYRLTIAQDEIAKMPERVRECTELMLAYEGNNTLDQWRGFAFDIEGHAYNWYYSFDDPFKSKDVWNEVLDYLELKSFERGKTIEAECVSSSEYAIDEKFDGDLDLQVIEGQVCYLDGFTTYAPMIYRCWPSGTPPYGSEKTLLDESWKWGTSYMIYSRLTAMTAYKPAEQLGVYLGITNTSCYGRDLPQEEKISWGEATGVDNLMRDILIAKHFNITEITFFLQFTHTESDTHVFGGLVDSYGPDILDRIDEAVNINPPESFTIYYDHSDASLTEAMSRDYMCDYNTISLQYILLLVWVVYVISVIGEKSKIFKRL